jgi:hypothetical protein
MEQISKDLNEFTIKQMEKVDRINLKEKIELHIQQISGLMLGAKDEETVLVLTEVLSGLRRASDGLKRRI